MSQSFPDGAVPAWRARGPLLAVLVCVLVLYPACCLCLRGSANGLLFLACAIGLLGLTRLGEGGAANWPSARRDLALLGCLPVLATLINQVSRGVLVPKNFDLPLRFALLGPCLAAFGPLRPRHFRHLQWGLMAGALGALAMVLLASRGVARANQIGALNAIPFGDISLLLGVLSLLTLGWRVTRTRVETVGKLLAGLAGLLASLLSQSRGGWLALPLFAALLWWALRPARRPGRRQVLLAGVLVLALALGAGRVAWPRLQSAAQDVSAYVDGGPRDTAVGMRFQVWAASLTMLREHPLTGVGYDRFRPTLQAYAQAGRVSPAIAGLPHSHNEILFVASTTGLLGLLALLGVQLGPLRVLWPALRRGSRQTRCAAAMGLCVTLGFLVFGATEVLFIISMTTAIYVFLTAALLAFTLASASADRARQGTQGH